jgi:hypothetical protein
MVMGYFGFVVVEIGAGISYVTAHINDNNGHTVKIGPGLDVRNRESAGIDEMVGMEITIKVKLVGKFFIYSVYYSIIIMKVITGGPCQTTVAIQRTFNMRND